MQDNTSRQLTGVDIGTSKARVVVGNQNDKGELVITGVGEALISGMRKGVVVNLNGPAKAIDEALGKAERMSGVEINQATININGPSILSTNANGMIAIGDVNQEVSNDDLSRIEEVATVGKIPANREVLSVVAHDYILDGQSGIKDPLGMTGARLEINANVISVLIPHLQNLRKTAQMAGLVANDTIVSVVAGSQAVLTESEQENGVAIIDLGASTTGIAIYEEGDLKYVSIIPVGAHNITNDLAIGLQTSPEIAEEVKIDHGSAIFSDQDKKITIKVDKQVYEFNLREIDEIIEARLEEIFKEVEKRLQKAGYAGKLPSGVVLIGGGACLKGIDNYVRNALGLATRVAKPKNIAGLSEKVESPDYAVAVGLMKMDLLSLPSTESHESNKNGLFGKISNLFKGRH